MTELRHKSCSLSQLQSRYFFPSLRMHLKILAPVSGLVLDCSSFLELSMEWHKGLFMAWPEYFLLNTLVQSCLEMELVALQPMDSECCYWRFHQEMIICIQILFTFLSRQHAYFCYALIVSLFCRIMNFSNITNN